MRMGGGERVRERERGGIQVRKTNPLRIAQRTTLVAPTLRTTGTPPDAGILLAFVFVHTPYHQLHLINLTLSSLLFIPLFPHPIPYFPPHILKRFEEKK